MAFFRDVIAGFFRERSIGGEVKCALKVVHGGNGIFALVRMNLAEAIMDFRGSWVIAEGALIGRYGTGKIARSLAFFCNFELVIGVVEPRKARAGRHKKERDDNRNNGCEAVHGSAQFFDAGVFNGSEDGLCDFDAGEPFEVCWDDSPRSVGGVGSEKHFFSGFIVFVPLATIAPVFVGDFPVFVGISLSSFESAQLFIL